MVLRIEHPGNFNNEIGVPISLISTYNADYSIIEMGTSCRGFRLSW